MSVPNASRTPRFQYVDAPSIYSAFTADNKPAGLFIVGARRVAYDSQTLTADGRLDPLIQATINGWRLPQRNLRSQQINFIISPEDIEQHVNNTLHGLDAEEFMKLQYNQPAGITAFARSLQRSIETHTNTGIAPPENAASDRSFQVVLESRASDLPLADARRETYWPNNRPPGVSFAWIDRKNHDKGLRAVLYSLPSASRITGGVVGSRQRSEALIGKEDWFSDVVERFKRTRQVVSTELERLFNDEAGVTEAGIATAIASIYTAHTMTATTYGTLPSEIEERKPDDRPVIEESNWRYRVAGEPVLKAWRRPGE